MVLDFAQNLQNIQAGPELLANLINTISLCHLTMILMLIKFE